MKQSAGTVLFKRENDRVLVLLVHMGGPFWARKDEHAWSIPKGEYDDGEDPHAVAGREFAEELGSALPEGPEFELGQAKQSGKSVVAFARGADFDASTCVSNTFELEWPPKSGKMQRFPEVDRCEFFSIAQATRKIKESQIPLIEALQNAR